MSDDYCDQCGSLQVDVMHEHPEDCIEALADRLHRTEVVLADVQRQLRIALHELGLDR